MDEHEAKPKVDLSESAEDFALRLHSEAEDMAKKVAEHRGKRQVAAAGSYAVLMGKANRPQVR
jgi:hypothetical protein